jgi:hypothetical protein
VHNFFFTSLGIPVPPREEFARAKIWPVLSKERDNQKEILVIVRSNDLPNLPLHIRCMSAPQENWTLASVLEDLTRSVESELEEKILRFSLSVATLALGSQPRQRELQGCGPKGSLGVKPRGSRGVKPGGCPGVKARGSPGVTSHTPGSVKKC